MANFDNKNFLKAALIFWVIVIGTILALLSTRALASDFRFEVGTGFNVFKEQHDGAWYQEAYPHWMDMQSTPFTIGISNKFGKYRLRAEFDYLGPMFIQAMATPDGAYNPANIGCVDSGTCDVYVLQGRGSTSGALFMVQQDIGEGPFFVEAGLFASVHKWQVSVMKPDGTLLAEVAREHQINYGPAFGVGYDFGGLSAVLRYYYLDDSSAGDPITPAHEGAITVLLIAGF